MWLTMLAQCCVVLSGCVVDVGYGVTQLTAVWEGFHLQNCIKGTSIYTEFGAIDTRRDPANDYVLPDGACGLASNAAELYASMPMPQGFKGYTDDDGKELFSDLLKNTVVVGGTSMNKAFGKRFKEELLSKVAGSLQDRVKVIQGPERVNNSYIGTLVVGSLDSCPWVSKSEYNEKGLRRMMCDQYMLGATDGSESPEFGHMNSGRPVDARIQLDTSYSESDPSSIESYWARSEIQEET